MQAQKQETKLAPELDSAIEELRQLETLFQLKSEDESKYFDDSAQYGEASGQEKFTSARTQVLIKVDYKSPSELEGLRSYDEIVLRRTYAGVIKQVGIALGHPNETINLAQNIFQRFFLR